MQFKPCLIVELRVMSKLKRNHIGRSVKREQGAILIVAMVILLVMTVLGIGSRVNTIMQQKMSVAYQQKGVAHLAAEAALRAAETFLTNNVSATTNLALFNNAAIGLYSNWTMTGQIDNPVWVEAVIGDVVDPAAWDNNNSIAVLDYDATAANQPRYVIEYVGQDVMGTGNKVVVDYNDPNLSADTSPHVFQIYAIGWSRDAGIYSVLQSSYRTGNVSK
jgi:type IV pilus assembly protein PilX